MWSWGLGGASLLMTWLTGRKLWWAWVIGLADLIAWIVYSVLTRQYGFIPECLVLGGLYAHNARSWYRQGRVDGGEKEG